MKLKTTLFSILLLALAAGCGGDEEKGAAAAVSAEKADEMLEVLMMVVDGAGNSVVNTPATAMAAKSEAIAASATTPISYTSPDGDLVISGSCTFDDVTQHFIYNLTLNFNNYTDTYVDEESQVTHTVTLNGTVNWVLDMMGSQMQYSYDGAFTVEYDGVTYSYAWALDYSINYTTYAYSVIGSYTINGYTWAVNESEPGILSGVAPSRKLFLKRR